MKKIFSIAIAMLLANVPTSCKDDFLDTKPSATPADPTPEQKLYGIYALMIQEGAGGIDTHEDFGQKGIDIYTDLLSSDMALTQPTYGWYNTIAKLQSTLDYQDSRNYLPWRYYYKIIVSANQIIDGIEKKTGSPSQSDKYSIGQAKTMRAYAYFNLAQLYLREYNPSEQALPVYNKFGLPTQPLSTQKEVYDFIIADLQDAINLLEGFQRPNIGVVDKNIAKGYLAYTYAAIGENAKAAEVSQDIINTSGYPMTNDKQALGGFNKADKDTNPSWMWGYDITTDNGLYLASWWGQMDIFTYSYQAAGNVKSIDENLYNSIKDVDIRKKQFGNIKSLELIPLNKFYNGKKVVDGQRTIEDDYIFMRVDEFYLLAAETLAKSGDEAKAKEILKNYLSDRWGTVDPKTGEFVKDDNELNKIDALSGKALQDEIYLNTRIEFWGEGKSFYAFKRNRATVTRGQNHAFLKGETIKYNEERVSFTIPEKEKSNNPYL